MFDLAVVCPEAPWLNSQNVIERETHHIIFPENCAELQNQLPLRKYMTSYLSEILYLP